MKSLLARDGVTSTPRFALGTFNLFVVSVIRAPSRHCERVKRNVLKNGCRGGHGWEGSDLESVE